MSVNQPSNMEQAAQAFATIGKTMEQLPKLAADPSVEALGPINFDDLEERDKPFFRNLLPYKTSGASDTIFINCLSISSHATGPKIRVPLISPN